MFFSSHIHIHLISATLSWLAHPFQIWLAFSVFRILLLELSHKNLGSATLLLFSRICIGFQFATELVSKLPRLLLECSSLSSHPIFHLSSQDMCRREHSALLRLSQYAFLHVKPPWQLPNHFHLLLQVFGIHCQTICLPFQLFLFLEELSNITYSSSLTLTVVQNLASIVAFHLHVTFMRVCIFV